MITVFRANHASVGFAALARRTEIGHAKRGADNHDRVCEYGSRAPSRDIIGMRRYQLGPASPAIICDEQPFSLSSLVRDYGLLSCGVGKDQCTLSGTSGIPDAVMFCLRFFVHDDLVTFLRTMDIA